MLIKETKLVEKEVLREVVCNCCGRTLETDENGYYEDFLHLEKTWGYGAHQDGLQEEADLCEDCWEKIKRMFRLSTEL